MNTHNILMIDDDPEQTYLYSLAFKGAGIVLAVENDPIKGLEKAEQEQPELILLDVLMESMDGLKVLEQLKKNPKTKDIPVVMLTNISKRDIDFRARQANATAVIEKTKLLPKDVVSMALGILG